MKIKNPVAIVKARRAAKRYDAQIKASQEKIGPYVPRHWNTIYS